MLIDRMTGHSQIVIGPDGTMLAASGHLPGNLVVRHREKLSVTLLRSDGSVHVTLR
jgi:hypothetical protein